MSEPASAAREDGGLGAPRRGLRPASQVIPRPPTARRGGPAPWADLAAARRRPSLDEIRRAVAVAGPPRPSALEGTGVRASAVLAPFYDAPEGPVVILTRRAAHLRAHRGEVSFPGGAWEEGDGDLAATALREACEEIGLAPEAVEVIGEIDHLQTVTSRSYIVPFVGVLAGRPELVASEDEVAAILHVPVAELMAPDVYHEERWGLPPLEHPIHFFELDGDIVWGATAAMLRNLLALVTDSAAA